MSNPAFRGPHKINFKTPRLGHNLSIRLSPSKYESILQFRRTYQPFINSPEILVVHYTFFQKLCLFFKYILSCIFPKK